MQTQARAHRPGRSWGAQGGTGSRPRRRLWSALGPCPVPRSLRRGAQTVPSPEPLLGPRPLRLLRLPAIGLSPHANRPRGRSLGEAIGLGAGREDSPGVQTYGSDTGTVPAQGRSHTGRPAAPQPPRPGHLTLRVESTTEEGDVARLRGRLSAVTWCWSLFPTTSGIYRPVPRPSSADSRRFVTYSVGPAKLK